MEKLPEYKHFAELCRKLAANMGGEHRKSLEEMACAWDSLARESKEESSPSRPK
jgi:hypothetical protein